MQIGLSEPDTVQIKGGGYLILDFGREQSGGIRILTHGANGDKRVRLFRNKKYRSGVGRRRTGRSRTLRVRRSRDKRNLEHGVADAEAVPAQRLFLGRSKAGLSGVDRGFISRNAKLVLPV